MQSLAVKCKWLKENVGILYEIKDLPEKTTLIIYDRIFSDEIKQYTLS